MDFVNNGKINEAGQKLVAWMDAQDTPDPDRFNALTGIVKHFLVNVRKMRSISEAQWLADYEGRATILYEGVQAVEAAAAEAQKVTEAVETTSKLEQALAELKEKVEVQAAEIAALKEGKGEAAPKKGRKAKDPNPPADDDEEKDNGDAPE